MAFVVTFFRSFKTTELADFLVGSLDETELCVKKSFTYRAPFDDILVYSGHCKDSECFCGTIPMDPKTPESSTPINKGTIGNLITTPRPKTSSTSRTEDPFETYDHIIFDDSEKDYGVAN